MKIKGFIMLLGVLLLASSFLAGCAQPDLTLEESIQKEIVRAIGKTKQKLYPDRVLNVHIDELEGFKKAFILLVADEGSTGQEIKERALQNATRLFPVLFDKFEELEGIHLEWQAPMTKESGVVALGTFLHLSLRHENVEVVKSDTFIPDEFQLICEYYQEIPGL